MVAYIPEASDWSLAFRSEPIEHPYILNAVDIFHVVDFLVVAGLSAMFCSRSFTQFVAISLRCSQGEVPQRMPL
jgi:hypothetical protein